MRISPLVVLAVVSVTTVARSQTATYRAPSDTVYVAASNPYRAYWVRGTDTTGQAVREVSVEAQAWREEEGGLSVVVRQLLLNASRRLVTDTFSVTPDGRVLSVNGKPAGMHGRVDLLLRLPPQPMTAGAAWSDTVETRGAGPAGEHRYRLQRTYHVVGPVDSLGRKLVRVEATGTARYRDGWWADSSRGITTWLDVEGPVSETFLFDPSAGQLVARTWRMDLRGRGAIPGARGGQDTLPAGLQSSEDAHVVPAEIARVAFRDLPAGDTSWTISGGGRILLHTVRRSADEVESGLTRNDGLVGVARADFSSGVPTRYAAEWTEGVAPVSKRVVERRGPWIVIRGGGADSVLAIPTAHWGIADYAMEESLVPVLMRMPADTVVHPFAVYRPFARHWDQGRVTLRPIPGARVVAMQLGDATQPEIMIITDDGDFIYGSDGRPNGAERVPPPGTARRARLEALVSAGAGKRKAP